jgi:contact-dependent growth inhibition (CDI) system restriction endonuclease-like protein
MIYPFWRLSEDAPDNLGLACTDHGLLLGRTPLIERRDGRFVARDRDEIARLLMCVFPEGFAVDRLMSGLATVASALNANDPALARIAAVHLQIPDLPTAAARDAMIAEDALIKYARDEGRAGDWNPALHPRTGAPPNPGWFAPTGGVSEASSGLRVAENHEVSRDSDVGHISIEERARVPHGEYIDELADFVEWLVNAKPEDERTIRAEIRRYYYDVGDMTGGHQLNAALSDVLEPGTTLKDRQEILNGIAPYAHSDPAEVGQFRALITGAILATPGSGRRPNIEDAREVLQEPESGRESRSKALAPQTETPSDVWSWGWARRGRYLEDEFGRTLHPNFPTIDKIPDSIATSIKSIDVRAATYRNSSRLADRVGKYINDVSEFDGATWAEDEVTSSEIKGRALLLIVPKGSLTPVQREELEALRTWARMKNDNPVNVVIKEY